jgi:hypothetical protein
MPSLEKIIEELQSLSDRLSTQVRTIAIGLLAVSWTILVGESTTLRALAENLRPRLLIVICLSVGTLVVDFLQYFFGYLEVNKTRRAAENAGKSGAEYDYRSIFWILRSFLFWLKQIAVLVASILFIALLIPYVYSS